MEDLLTSRQVQDILKVDRITVYRMLQDGRLKGVKIGQQWRFPRREVDRLLGGETPAPAAPAGPDATFPTHCIQTIQDLFSDVGQVASLVIDAQGQPITETSRACEFCQLVQASPSGLAACRQSWREFTRRSADGSRYFTCHAGLQYMTAPVLDKDEPIGLFAAGQFYWQPPDPREENDRIRRLASDHNLDAAELQAAAANIAVIPADQRQRAESWPVQAARAVQSILVERTHFIERLKQIANLTQLS